MLQIHLRERDKDKVNCERVTSEVNGVCCKEGNNMKLQVEHLEHQLLQMTKTFNEEAQRCSDLETERNEAVEKIKLLREIIRDLEVKCDSKNKELIQLVEKLAKLEYIIEEQESSGGNVRHLDSSENVSDVSELHRHIEHLQDELQQLRLNSELVGSDGASLQIKKELFELEQQIDKKTKDLEVWNYSEHTNCSSPSEDISARDIARMNSAVMDECEIPLQQLARLKEKLVRHSRAEDAAVKRIKDLEMQVFGLKGELEEASNEKEYLKKQIQEQLVLISDLQIRLDEQRIRAEHIEKQTNTSLEMKIYDMTNEISSLRDKLQHKDKMYNQMQGILAETQERLKCIEKEASCIKEDEIIVSMQKELEILRKENLEMKTKIEKEAQIVPNLVENIISDKNMDIEKLKEKLDETEKILDVYKQLNLSNRELQTLSNLKTSGTSITEVLSILDLSQVDQVRRADSGTSIEGIATPEIFKLRKDHPDETKLEPEISAISPAMHSLPIQRNSTAVCQKKVHFEDPSAEHLRTEIANLKENLKTKDDIIKTYEERLQLLDNLENKIEKLQLSLEETEKALANATDTFEKEQKELRGKAQDLGVELAEKKLIIEEQEKKIEMLEQDSERKDEMCLGLAKEKRDLENALIAVKKHNFDSIDAVIKEKNKEIEEVQKRLSLKSTEDQVTITQQIKSKDSEIASLQSQIDNWSYQYSQLQETLRSVEENLKIGLEENDKLTKELQNKIQQIESITAEHNSIREKLMKKKRNLREYEDTVDRQKRTITTLESETKNLKELLADRECEIEIANEDAKRYQNDLAALEHEIKLLKKADIDSLNNKVKERDAKIEELIKEKAQMVELIKEKEKMINQMAEDSKNLHINLMTIKNKIQEPGNIIDLGNKLREEQKKNADLVQEIHELKAQILALRNAAVTSVDDITHQLKKELDYSAQIDSNIINAVSDHSLNSLSDNSDIEAYRKALTKERNSRKMLVYQINSLQAKNSELLRCLQQEKAVLTKVQADDAKIIEQLRIQLDAVLDNDDGMRKALEDKIEHIKQLENELDGLRKKNTNNSTSKSESTEYKNLPSKSSRELNQLRTDYEILKTARNQLLNDFLLLKQEQADTAKELERARENVQLSNQVEKNLQEQIDKFVVEDMHLKESLVKTKLRIEQLVEELSQERVNFAKEREALIEQVKAQAEIRRENERLSALPDEVMNKIRELNGALLDNKKLVTIIQRLTSEKKSLENELECLRRNEPEKVDYYELTSWSQNLFARTLRLESIRKALIWQKRYLMDYARSHEMHCLIQPDRSVVPAKKKLNPRRNFRAVVHVLISIHRMNYLVKRWHSSERTSEKISWRHHKNVVSRIAPIMSTNFHVGQPVSSQLFSNVPSGSQTYRSNNPFVEAAIRQGKTATNIEEILPWSGQTPPSKEKIVPNLRIGSNIIRREELTPLQAPQLLSQFSERINQLQEKMGLVLDTNQS